MHTIILYFSKVAVKSNQIAEVEMDEKTEQEKQDEYNAKVTHSDVTENPLDAIEKDSKKDMRQVVIAAIAFIILAVGIAIGAALNGSSDESGDSSSQGSETTSAEDEIELTVADIEAHVRSIKTVWSPDLDAVIQEYDSGNDNVSYAFSDSSLTITGNGLPDHETGDFPNQNNPNSISEQDVNYIITRSPSFTGTATDVRISGITLGGIPMEPGTAERDPETGWSIEAFNPSRIFRAGTDDNNAHVQPDGTYHYHGLPSALLTYEDESQHSNLIGFAADGFPIYGDHGYRDPTNPDGPVDHMTSSWRLKEGERGPGEPEGTYTGDYTQDFEYIENYGDLDECNGRFTVTPEFPDGIYAYFMTENFPFIGRCVQGEVLDSFAAQQTPEGLPPRP